ncbi:interaptin [Daktulosphaira vitifoliae]|uniref:interaptin n=1 Tax=Daktulosphaira vitifoliae TaxID=58002 RepID=UPI0021AA57E0|nr:interaptin [Daktulosphaira vitifoliae]
MEGAEEEGNKKKLHLNVEEATCGGSDSGVDVTPAASCDSSLASGCYDPCKSPVGPFSPTSAGPSSLPCYTAGSFSSRPSTPTWRRSDRTKMSNSMSSSFHFESNGNRTTPPKTADTSSSRKPDLNAVAKQSKISTVKKLVSTYDMVKSLDRYATLPRRKRKSKENIATVVPPVATPPKEPSLNRAASLRRKHIEQGAAAAAASSHYNSTPSPHKSTLPKVTRIPPTTPVKTKIYHEVYSQTCLTGNDITSILAGNVLTPIENRVETNDAQVHVDLVSKKIDALETDLKEKTEKLDCKMKELNEQQECIKELQQQLNQDNVESCKQIDAYSLRLCNIFQINDCLDPTPSNILQILERQATSTTCIINDQQKEISNLKCLCNSLHRDLEKSYAAQKSLLQANQAAEMESSEIQEFLQTEKSMLLDTIKDLEKEIKETKEQFSIKEKEASKHKDQCIHLVRISEQRRQENLTLQAKLRAMENKTRELLQQQDSTVSGAIVGLSKLGNRLDLLLDKLIKSYSISDSDIEDEVYFNEAYTNGDSNSDSEQHLTSSKTDSKSLLSAIVSAIKSAPSSWQKGKPNKHFSSSSNINETNIYPAKRSVSLKEFQNGDCQIINENNLSADLLSNNDSLDDCSDLQSVGSESLNNLSEAIFARQKLESSVNFGVDGLEFLEDFKLPDADLLDQVIELDNTVTRLLKVLTIAQGNNKEQISEKSEIIYNNGINRKNRRYSSQPSLLNENDETNCKYTPLVSVQELNTNPHKTLNGII